ncbi:MAG: hypothetical protein FWH52_07735 [Synergistaceae bacterium]|nr:hypothetical protein [Synergistaceae bacterium]
MQKRCIALELAAVFLALTLNVTTFSSELMIAYANSNSAGEETILPGARDPWKWPFLCESIWNTPIGSNAVYVPSGLQESKYLGADIYYLIEIDRNDPLREIRSIYRPGKENWSLWGDDQKYRWPGFPEDIFCTIYPGNNTFKFTNFSI